MPIDMPIALKPAHEALETLLKQLDSLPPEALFALEGTVRKKQPPPRLQNAQSWIEALRMAKQGLEEWCPGGGFSLDQAPKR
jgi:hypothetical protein